MTVYALIAATLLVLQSRYEGEVNVALMGILSYCCLLPYYPDLIIALSLLVLLVCVRLVLIPEIRFSIISCLVLKIMEVAVLINPLLLNAIPNYSEYFLYLDSLFIGGVIFTLFYYEDLGEKKQNKLPVKTYLRDTIGLLILLWR